MKNVFLFLKKNIFIILSSIFFGLSIVFAYIIFNTMGYFGTSGNTMVGTIAISNYETSQYPAIITSEVNEWRSDAIFTVSYQGYEYEIDLDLFALQIQDTIDGIDDGQENSVIFTLSDISKLTIENELELVFSEYIMSEIDMDAFTEEIIKDMGYMNILKHYRLESFFSNNDLDMTVIDSVTITSLSSEDVNNIIDTLSVIQIDGNSRFSILEKLGEYEFSNNQLSIIASGIQKITSETPFTGFVFSQNGILPIWAEEGMNVMILKTNQYDFTFFNDLDLNYTVEIEQTSSTSIELRLVGYPFVADYSITKLDETVIPKIIEYYENPDLDETTEGIIIIDTAEETIFHLLVQEGLDGKIVCYTRTITLPDSTVLTEIIYREIYYPTIEIYQENIVEK